MAGTQIRKAKLIVLFCLCQILAINAFADRGPKNDSVEITKTDITALRNFNGNHVSFFGIALGMGKSVVRAKLNLYPYFKLTSDAFNPTRFYLDDASSDTSKQTIAYLIWPKYDTGLYQIILYPAAAKYMKATTADIVSPACIDPSSEVYKFLGEPSAKVVTSDIPSIKSKTTQLYYPKYNFVIEESKSDEKVQYNLIFTRKW